MIPSKSFFWQEAQEEEVNNDCCNGNLKTNTFINEPKHTPNKKTKIPNYTLPNRRSLFIKSSIISSKSYLVNSGQYFCTKKHFSIGTLPQ